MQGLLIRDAEIEGARCDVRCEAGRVVALGRGLAAEPGDLVHEAAGGALLPGLHDHHLHLLAWAAAEASVRCGPPEVRDEPGLVAALSGAASAAPAADARAAPAPGASAASADARAAPGAAISSWLRGVGYHESVAGPLDRERLDAFAPGRALRIQHRSGALWMLSSEAVRRIGLDTGADAPGVERDARGLATGRLFRLDAWLRQRLGDEAPPPLAPLGLRLARFGVTGVTDATPELGPAALAALGDAVRRGALPQRLVLLGAAKPGEGVFALGPRKLVLDERALPALDELAGAFEQTHAEGRAVAVHCVTRAELVLALAAFDAAGARAGDRLEHASVAPPDALEWIARLALTVVTQPGFVRTRGDDYLREVEPRDRPWLYRCAGFERAGVALGAGTDAPFGDPDPWLAMQAAVDRRSAAGQRLGEDEGLSPERALALFTSAAQAPGGPPRRVALGAAADLCLLDRPWARARDALTFSAVAATFRAGRPLFRSR